MTHKEFETIVVDSILAMPDYILSKLDNVDVVVEQWPTIEQLNTSGSHDYHSLLGLYEGVPIGERSHYNFILPDKITIFQQPLQSLGLSKEGLKKQIRITVVHEVAHHFGIDDEKLSSIGL